MTREAAVPVLRAQARNLPGKRYGWMELLVPPLQPVVAGLWTTWL